MIFSIFAWLSLGLSADAAVLILENGSRVEGAIVSQDDDTVKMRLGGGVELTYFRDEIASISEGEFSSINDIVVGGGGHIDPAVPQEELPMEIALDMETPAPETAEDASMYYLKINPMEELDFRSKDEIYQLRQNYVQQYPKLGSPHYQPSEAVFGQIDGEKPWWGILGIYYYGNTFQSIDGPSEESRFISNPYLLVGVLEENARIVTNSSLEPKAFYPMPKELMWSKSREFGFVSYDVSAMLREGAVYKYPETYQKTLYLSMINARDFGFYYFQIDLAKSRNIRPLGLPADGIFEIDQYVHLGPSCGYPGGCNNVSPFSDKYRFRFSALPAVLYIRLWRHNPSGGKLPQEDMAFLIELN